MNALVRKLEDEAWVIARAAELLAPGGESDGDAGLVRQALFAIACRLGDSALLAEYGRRAEPAVHNLAMTLGDDEMLALSAAGLAPRPLPAAWLYLKGLQLWTAVANRDEEVARLKAAGLALMLLGRRAAPPGAEGHPLEALAREALLSDIALRECLPRLEDAFARALADAAPPDA